MAHCLQKIKFHFLCRILWGCGGFGGDTNLCDNGVGYPSFRGKQFFSLKKLDFWFDQIDILRCNFVMQNERNATTRFSGPEQTCSENRKFFRAPSKHVPKVQVQSAASLKGNTVSAEGNTVPAKGNSISANGDTVSIKGTTISAKGNTVSAKGNAVSPK